MPAANNAPRNGTAGLKAQTGITQAPPMSPADQISAMIRAEMPRIQRLIQNPKMTQRFGQLAMTEMRKNPALLNCEPSTVLGCLMTAASLGLQIGVGGQAYLIPYNDHRNNRTICTFVPGWKGLMSLMLRTGEAEAQTGVVRKGDAFRFALGSDPYIEHEIRSERDAEITHFYAWGRATTAKYPIVEVWTKADIDRHLSRHNKVGGMHYALKDKGLNFEMYGRKIPLLQVLKYLPVSFEMEQAMDLDGEAEGGRQNIKPADVIEGVVMPPMSELGTNDSVPDSDTTPEPSPAPNPEMPEPELGMEDEDTAVKSYDFSK